MKKSGILLLVLFAFGSIKVSAQSYKTAVGVRFSSNDALVGTGVSLRHFVKGSTALEAIVAFDPVAIGILAEKFKPLSTKGLSWFYGGGAYVALEGRNVFGAMGVLGLDYKFATAPLNLSLDWKPELFLINEVAFEPAAVGLSIRFAF